MASQEMFKLWKKKSEEFQTFLQRMDSLKEKEIVKINSVFEEMDKIMRDTICDLESDSEFLEYSDGPDEYCDCGKLKEYCECD